MGHVAGTDRLTHYAYSPQRVRAAVGDRLSAEQQAKFTRRYDRLVTLAAKLNQPRPPAPQPPRAKRQKIPKPIKSKNPATALVVRLRDNVRWRTAKMLLPHPNRNPPIGLTGCFSIHKCSQGRS